jgi:hypothetical protein
VRPDPLDIDDVCDEQIDRRADEGDRLTDLWSSWPADYSGDPLLDDGRDERDVYWREDLDWP